MDIHTICFCRMTALPAGARRNNNVIVTSKWCRDVFWRNNDVVIVSCANWACFFHEQWRWHRDDIENNDRVALHCIAGVCRFVFTCSLLSTYIASCLKRLHIFGLKSREIAFVHNIPFSHRIVMKFCTGAAVSLLCSVQNSKPTEQR